MDYGWVETKNSFNIFFVYVCPTQFIRQTSFVCKNSIMERKDFIKSACTLCGLIAVGSFLPGCKKESTAAPESNFTVDLSDGANIALLSSGGVKLINGIYIINKDGTNYTGVSSICTHEGCSINYMGSSSGFRCPCHGATFSVDGVVTGGPARTNLKVYTVVKNGNVLTVT